VTDSASQYAAACHQVNLCVGDIFKESDDFDVVANNACKIATYFTSKTHTYFIGKLKDEQQLQYRKYVNLIRPCETQWNSYFYCLTSILNTNEALKTLVARYEPDYMEAQISRYSRNNNL
ncbi:15158_t:CDS:2, partial [Entrophospora sp. SA101]